MGLGRALLGAACAAGALRGAAGAGAGPGPEDPPRGFELGGAAARGVGLGVAEGAGMPSEPAAGPGGAGLSLAGAHEGGICWEFSGLSRRSVTVSAWVRMAAHKDWNRLVTHAWIGDGWNLYTDAAGVARFAIGQGHDDFGTGRVVFRDKWHYLVGTYDGKDIRVYVDGLPGTPLPFPDADLEDTGYVSVGGAEWDPMVGDIDEVRIFNYALSQEEVNHWMVNQPTGDEPGLVGYWRMDEGVGVALRDRSGRGNDMLLAPFEESAIPKWISSDAPVATLCPPVSETGFSELQLPGFPADRGRYIAVVEQRPGMEVLARAGHREGEPVGSTVDYVDGMASLAVQAPFEGASSRCLEVKYRVRGIHGGETSQVGTSLVEIPSRMEGPRDRDWVCSQHTWRGECWKLRTRTDPALLSQIAEGEKPRVSIVIPLFNQADWLVETVSSVVAQTWNGRWEVIIVNDGSTDDGRSADTARQMASRHAHLPNGEIRVIQKRNGGLADARNAGVRAARADWILPLDSDDLLGETFLEEAFARIDESSSDAQLNLVIANLKGFGTKNYHWNLPEYDAYDLRYSNMFHCSALYRRELWDSVPGGYPVATVLGYEDWAFWIAAEQNVGIRAVILPEQLFFYRIRPDSMHQTLLNIQEFSTASVRMLNPQLYPVELILGAHDRFLNVDIPDRLKKDVASKTERFPWNPTVQLMQGLIMEGAGDGSASLRHFNLAVDAAVLHDWQPRWRLGLLQQRLGRFSDSNATMQALFRDFTGLKEAYENLQALSLQRHVVRGPYVPRR